MTSLDLPLKNLKVADPKSHRGMSLAGRTAAGIGGGPGPARQQPPPPLAPPPASAGGKAPSPSASISSGSAKPATWIDPDLLEIKFNDCVCALCLGVMVEPTSGCPHLHICCRGCYIKEIHGTDLTGRIICRIFPQRCMLRTKDGLVQQLGRGHVCRDTIHFLASLESPDQQMNL